MAEFVLSEIEILKNRLSGTGRFNPFSIILATTGGKINSRDLPNTVATAVGELKTWNFVFIIGIVNGIPEYFFLSNMLVLITFGLREILAPKIGNGH